MSCRRPRSLSWAVSNHRRISSSRNRHCLPTFSAGISPHSAQKHTVRVDIPSHLATVAVERNASCCSPFGLRITERLQNRCDDSAYNCVETGFQNRCGMSRQHDAIHRAFQICEMFFLQSFNLIALTLPADQDASGFCRPSGAMMCRLRYGIQCGCPSSSKARGLSSRCWDYRCARRHSC